MVTIDGEDVARRDPVELRRSIGYVFQGIGLFPHLDIAGNIGMVPRLLGWDAATIHRRTIELLDLVRLDPVEHIARMPAELSGGQQQRVGFARALAARPKVMLLDEPFGALDPLTRDSLRRDFRRLHDEFGLTTVLVTHDMTLTFMYQAVRDGEVDLITAYSTDGRIDAFDLKVLSDPLQAFPPYDAVLLLSPRAARDAELQRVLRPLVNAIPDRLMRSADGAVDVHRRPVAEAAESLHRRLVSLRP